MLYLRFTLAGARFGVPAAAVTAVVPWVALAPLPHAPAGVCGVLNYHGQSVPVLDLQQLVQRTPCAPAYGTRIILVSGVTSGLLGLLAETVLDTFRPDSDFIPSGLPQPDAPYLDGVMFTADGMVQQINLAGLLPATLQTTLAATGA
ncbi:MAG TPA: chemotaxis protein CheW [bacterium]|mgnify:CR=1 FL=1|nr:chemotaxis protein CheW [bacterium]